MNEKPLCATAAWSTNWSHTGSRPVGLAALTMLPYTPSTIFLVSIELASARRKAASFIGALVVLGISIAVFAESMYGASG